MGASAEPAAAGQAVALPRATVRPRETRAARVGRLVASGPLNVFLLLVAVLWLVPTLGLLFPSVLPATEITREGWWNVVSQPSVATFDNYREIFDNAAITSALW